MHIIHLYQGTFSVGTDNIFRRIPRDSNPLPNTLKVSINPVILKLPNKRIVMMEAGIGVFGEGYEPSLHDRLLAQYDFKRDHITDIFLTHTHLDHIGGLLDYKNKKWYIAFPNAKIWVSKLAYEKFIHTKQNNNLKQDFVNFIHNHISPCFLDNNKILYSSIHTMTTHGHTKYHQIFRVETPKITVLFAGDILASQSQVNIKIRGKYDYEPLKTQHLREKLCIEAAKYQWIIAGYHDNHNPPFFQLKKHPLYNKYLITPWYMVDSQIL